MGETLLGQLDESTKERYDLTLEKCNKGLQGDDVATVRRTVDRMLMCCNAHFMQRSATINNGAKRKRDPADSASAVSPADAQAASSSSVEESSAASSFEPTATNTPAATLRAA